MRLAAVARGFLLAILVIILTLLMVATLLVFEVEGSLLSSDFYKDRLRDANAYAFLLNDVAEAAIDEARALPPSDGMSENLLNATGLSTERIVGSLNRALPPGWLRGQTEYNLDQIVSYLAGDTNRLTARLEVSDRVPQIVEEGGALIESADVHGIIYDLVLSDQLDSLYAAMAVGGMEIERERLERAFNEVFTKEWTERQVMMAYNEVAPYVTGQTDSFEVRLRPDGLKEALTAELTDFARGVDWRLFMSERAVEFMIGGGQGRSVRLVRGLDLPQSEVMEVLGDSVSQQVYEAVAGDVVGEAVNYMYGETDEPTVRVDLSDVKRQARPRMVDLARRSASEAGGSLPLCAAGQHWLPPPDVFGNPTFPSCYPLEIQAAADMERWVEEFNRDIEVHVDSGIFGRMPDQITLTETTFWNAMAYGRINLDAQSVEELRSLLSEGVAFTSDDLKSDLESRQGPGAAQNLEDARSFFQDGVEFTTADLIRAAPEIRLVRYELSRASQAKWILPALILLTLTLYIGVAPRGRRIIWTVGCLAFVSAFAFALFGPIYGLFIEPEVSGYFACSASMFGPSMSDFPRVGSLLCFKLFEIGVDSLNAIMGGAAFKAAVCMTVFGLLTLAALIWLRFSLSIPDLTQGILNLPASLRRRVKT